VPLLTAALLTACAPAASPTPPAGLGAAAGGVCLAQAALPDLGAAERAFTNQAHDAVHALAAAPALDRTLAGHLLEAMEQVEADFDAGAGAAELGADLAELRAAAEAALTALDEAVPPCD
jgi:hypothetical protein